MRSIQNIVFHVLSLGCPKNLVDSEKLTGFLLQHGFIYSGDPAQAGFIIINTCAFIQPAVEESIETILDLAAEFPNTFLVVIGCLAARYQGDELKKELPEKLVQILRDHLSDELKAELGRNTSSENSQQSGRALSNIGFAYLKIAEGCSRACSYCTIPSIRGPYKSSTIPDVIDEARTLASQGIKELILVAQDLARFGLDLGPGDRLPSLLQELSEIDGIEWIRLMYLYPDAIPKDLAKVVKNSRNILHYFDIPFQHASGKVLTSMGRAWKKGRNEDLIARLRDEIPDLVLRTTLMVGFPTEGDKEFEELLEFVEMIDFDHLGVFMYSPEESTKAFSLGDPVPYRVKKLRANQVIRLHKKQKKRNDRKKIGMIERGLVESTSSETDLLLSGRMWFQAPEIDGALYVTAGDADPGKIYDIKITGVHETDFFGEII